MFARLGKILENCIFRKYHRERENEKIISIEAIYIIRFMI